jgi:hypothetical protein
MKDVSVQVADQIYECLYEHTISRHKVYHATLHELSKSVDKLKYELEENAEDIFWKDLLSDLRLHRFFIVSSPIAVNFHKDQLIGAISKNIKACRLSYPDFVETLQKLLGTLKQLSEQDNNPLLETLLELVSVNSTQKAAVLLRGTHMRPFVEEVFSSHQSLKHLEIVNAKQLQGSHCYDQLFIFGPSCWYPDYVVCAPRAKDVHLIYYKWLYEKRISPPTFTKSFPLQWTKSDEDDTIKQSAIPEDDASDGLSNTSQVIPEINWESLSAKMVRQTHNDSHQELVPARLYLLADNQAVFLEEGDNAKVLVLDLEIDIEDEEDEEEIQPSKYIFVNNLREGMFLLLRTEGGGDYIVSIADNILGKGAEMLRKKQEYWKRLLRRAISEKGLETVCIELLYCGSERAAKETNVSNWMSSKNIRPRDDKDFEAILNYLGLQSRKAEFINAASQIHSAHRQAGFHIRKQLLGLVRNSDMRELHRKGVMEFELPQADGGSLTAFRIENMSPEVSNIAVSRLGHPIVVRDFLWHE